MKARTGHHDLAAGPLGPTLLRLVMPMYLGMVAIAMVGIVDAYFIGRLGTEALAAFGLCYPAVMLLQAMMFGLANGITASLARARGKRVGEPLGPPERLRVRVSLSLALLLSGGLAVVGALLGPLAFAAVTGPAIADLAWQYYAPYLLALVCLSIPMAVTACMRGFGETRSSATVMTLASLLNAGLDPVFMFGWGPIPAYGIAGASISTVVAYLVSATVALGLLGRALRQAGRGQAGDLRARGVVSEIAAIGGPAMLAQVLGPVAGATVTALAARFGVEALAGLGIMQRVDMLVMIVAVATGAGLMPLVGQLAGGGDMLRAAQALRMGRRAMVAWGLGVGLLFNLVAAPLIAVFTDAPAVAAVVRIAIFFAPVAYVGGGLNMTTMSCFNAVGHPMLATKLAAVFSLVLVPAGGYFGSELFGLPGLFGGFVSASALAAAVGTYWMRLAGLTVPREQPVPVPVPDSE